MLGHRIGGKRLGIIGMGALDSRGAPRPRFGLQITITTPSVAPMIARNWAPPTGKLDQMLRDGHLSVNCPHTPATIICSGGRLKLHPQGGLYRQHRAWRVIDEDMLIKLIEAGDIGGAGLDVYEHDPAIIRNWCGWPRPARRPCCAYGLGHIEAASKCEKVIINIRTFLDNHKPPDRVLPSML